ncbi:MAG: radical SAM family heme chaperone HemW [Bacteroidetes bacterium]|nr:radical SAM family heme chaperone HemW [Bacteroidota bacterium]
MKKTACYVHIPFCDHKCIYCDFYSIITSDNISNYLNAIKKEIEYYSNIYSIDRELFTVYFGGGTPSLMNPAYIKEIINHIKNKFNVSVNAEITLETNPGTVDLNKFIEFKKAGINRISVGIQSFDKEELKFLTRIHDSETAADTINKAKQAGFENISLDLIFNLPGQTKEKWMYNLQRAVELPIKHISAYSLILEKGTILNKMVIDGKVKMQDEDYDAELYEETIDFLTASGFNQYEVSNFALPGYECIHNKAYWDYSEYLSFGTSAHSFLNNKRWWNYSSLKFYIAAVEKMNYVVAGSEELSHEQMMEEYVMLALRGEGLHLDKLENLFGNEWKNSNNEYISDLIKKGFITKKNNFLKFTSKGYALCDEILSNMS